jgi:hypothetical protein
MDFILIHSMICRAAAVGRTVMSGVGSAIDPADDANRGYPLGDRACAAAPAAGSQVETRPLPARRGREQEARRWTDSDSMP